jgi:hypothetical protein
LRNDSTPRTAWTWWYTNVTRRRLIRLVVQIAVSVLLVGLLIWRIDFRDRVYLADGRTVTGRVLEPATTEMAPWTPSPPPTSWPTGPGRSGTGS